MLHKNVSLTRRFHIERGRETVPSPPNRAVSLKTPALPAGLQRVASTSRSQTEGAPHPHSRRRAKVLAAEAAGWLLCVGGHWRPLPLRPRRPRTQAGNMRMETHCPQAERMPQTDRCQGGPGRGGGLDGKGSGTPPRVTVRHGSPELVDVSQHHHVEQKQKQRQLVPH